MSSKKTYDFHFHIHFAHLIEERLRSRLAPLGIHPRQARILDALGRMERASQAQLAREFDLTAASMSTMTSRLMAAGFIERRVDELEQRSNVLTLTQCGSRLLEQIYREWEAIDRETIEVLGEENTAQYLTFSLQLRNAFGGSTPGEACQDGERCQNKDVVPSTKLRKSDLGKKRE